MLPSLDELQAIGDPMEYLELLDGETRKIRPVSWEIGKANIEPRDGRPPKAVRVIRLHVTPADKPELPHYWDVSAQHLLAGLLPYLERMPAQRHTFTITKHGRRPKARFTLDAEPLPAGSRAP